jgi:hypothetical protein
MIQVSLTGVDAFLLKLQRFNPFVSKRIPQIMAYYGQKMVETARNDHRYENRSGNLSRSITYKVDHKKWELSFYIDDSLVTNKGYNYGWVQHDGSGMGYKASKFFPTISPKLSSGGIPADHFLSRAYDKWEPEMIDEMKKAIRSIF